jgi:hypothetical protein
MRNKIALAIGGFLAALGIFAGVALAVGFPSGASADDPSPPPGMHQACEKMSPQAMERMHEGMMNAGGQMAEWMESGDHCPH